MNINKDQIIYQVILQHLFDFSPFEQVDKPFDVSNLVVYQPNKTVKFTSYEDVFNYIFNDEYVGQRSDKLEQHGQFVMLDGDKKHVLHVIFLPCVSVNLAAEAVASLASECVMFAYAKTIQHYADTYYGFTTCLVDNGI